MKKIKNKDYEKIGENISKLNENIQRIASLEQEIQEYIQEKLKQFKVDGESLEEFNKSHNKLLENTNEIVQDVTSSIDDYMSDRSDNWHETENGEATQTWLEEWQELEGSVCEPIDIIEVSVDLDAPDLEEYETPSQDRDGDY